MVMVMLALTTRLFQLDRALRNNHLLNPQFSREAPFADDLDGKTAGIVTVVTGVLAAHGAEDFRPPFHKTPYLKTVCSQANLWGRSNKDRMHSKGGPDFAWDRYPRDEVAALKA